MPFAIFLCLVAFLPLIVVFPCSHCSKGSFSDATQEMVGESKMTPPPSQTVATSGDAAPNPSSQEVRVVVSQNTTAGPLESPSEHVSMFSLAVGDPPSRIFL